MLGRLAVAFPFLIAVLLPPVGLLIGLSQMDKDRELGPADPRCWAAGLGRLVF